MHGMLEVGGIEHWRSRNKSNVTSCGLTCYDLLGLGQIDQSIISSQVVQKKERQEHGEKERKQEKKETEMMWGIAQMQGSKLMMIYWTLRKYILSLSVFSCSRARAQRPLSSSVNELCFLCFLSETLLRIKFNLSMIETTGSFSFVHFWSDYFDQRRMEQSTSSRLWYIFVYCCLKMPEPVCRQINFSPLWSNPDTCVVRSVSRGLWAGSFLW